VSKARIMYTMTVKQVREGLNDMKTVIVPNGIVEQHGYHLPLSTDIIAPEEIAARVSEITGCFVAPAMRYGFSGGMLPGTINVSPQVVSLTLMDIFRSLIAQGFKNIVVVLGHGGSEHLMAVNDAARNFQWMEPSYEGISISCVPLWEVSPTYMKGFEEGDTHAGKYETSLILALRPDLIQMDYAVIDDPIPAPPPFEGKEQDNKFEIPKVVPNPEVKVGVSGDPRNPSVEIGKAIVQECTDALVALIEQLERKY
jgi:creatinine amidohydrolase